MRHIIARWHLENGVGNEGSESLVQGGLAYAIRVAAMIHETCDGLRDDNEMGTFLHVRFLLVWNTLDICKHMQRRSRREARSLGKCLEGWCNMGFETLVPVEMLELLEMLEMLEMLEVLEVLERRGCL